VGVGRLHQGDVGDARAAQSGGDGDSGAAAADDDDAVVAEVGRGAG